MLSAASTVRHFSRRFAHFRINSTMPIQNVRNAPSRDMSTIPSWATFDPYSAGHGGDVYSVPNLVDGKWTHESKQKMSIIDPLDKNKGPIFTICDTHEDEVGPFIESLRKVPKSGLHNPLKNPERYLKYGDITRKVRRTFKKCFSMSIRRINLTVFKNFAGWSCIDGSRHCRVFCPRHYELCPKVACSSFG